jgi:hypothetical protein
MTAHPVSSRLAASCRPKCRADRGIAAQIQETYMKKRSDGIGKEDIRCDTLPDPRIEHP